MKSSRTTPDSFSLNNELRRKTSKYSTESEPLLPDVDGEVNNNCCRYFCKPMKTSSRRWWHHFKDIFEVRNVKEMVDTCTVQRPNFGRAKIWMLFLAMFCVSLANQGAMTIMFQFVQKLYKWDAKMLSIVNSFVFVGTAVVVAVSGKEMETFTTKTFFQNANNQKFKFYYKFLNQLNIILY